MLEALGKTPESMIKHIGRFLCVGPILFKTTGVFIFLTLGKNIEKGKDFILFYTEA